MLTRSQSFQIWNGSSSTPLLACWRRVSLSLSLWRTLSRGWQFHLSSRRTTVAQPISFFTVVTITTRFKNCDCTAPSVGRTARGHFCYIYPCGSLIISRYFSLFPHDALSVELPIILQITMNRELVCKNTSLFKFLPCLFLLFDLS